MLANANKKGTERTVASEQIINKKRERERENRGSELYIFWNRLVLNNSLTKKLLT